MIILDSQLQNERCEGHLFLSRVSFFPQVLTDVLIPATMQEMPERFVLSPHFVCNSYS